MEFVTRLHRCLESGKQAGGMFFGLNCPAAAELIVNGTELDFMAVELQHAPVSAADSVHVLRAVQAADPLVTPLVRLPSHDVYWIQQSLDAGYAGLIAPLVESADQARQLVKAAYFPPKGDRSIAMSVRMSLYGQKLDTFNERMVLLPQIESAKGLEHVEEIVAVEGVTGVFLGPADLSLSYGWDSQGLWSQKPFLDAAQRVLAACRKQNKPAAVLTGEMVRARELGFDIIGFAAELALVRVDMVAGINGKLAQLR